VPNSITTANITEFQSNVAMLLQQTDSRLAGAVTHYALKGEAAEVLEQFGQTTAVTGLGRHADTPILDVPQDRRWCYPTDVDWGTMVDKQDLLRLMIDPKSQMTAAGVAALQRAKDDIIAQAIFGTAKTGKTGSTSTSFLSGNIIANTVGGGGSAVGLNMAKLREARRILRKGEVNFEGDTIFAALPADKEADLFGEATVVNGDFNAGNAPIIANGRLAGILGIQFIHSERFLGGDQSQFTGSGYEIPVWEKSGVGLGIWNDVNVNVAEVPTKRFNWQVYMGMTVGATRLEEKRVVKILAA
jgi:hypothetical protein